MRIFVTGATGFVGSAVVRDLIGAGHRVPLTGGDPAGEGSVDGIVSERDVVRRLHSDGVGVLEGPVSAIMTAEVHTCGEHDDVRDLAGEMTDRRIRHVPVVRDGKLVAIVSIGDIVKQRIRDLAAERDQLEAYITQ